MFTISGTEGQEGAGGVSGSATSCKQLKAKWLSRQFEVAAAAALDGHAICQFRQNVSFPQRPQRRIKGLAQSSAAA